MSIKFPDRGIQVCSVLPKGKTDLILASGANFICALATIFRAPLPERDIAVTNFVQCKCVNAFVRACVCVCMRPSGFVQAITSTFMHECLNNLTQLLSLRSRSAV